eukprot:3004639-Pyramimonas_sp.AAC.1
MCVNKTSADGWSPEAAQVREPIAGGRRAYTRSRNQLQAGGGYMPGVGTDRGREEGIYPEREPIAGGRRVCTLSRNGFPKGEVVDRVRAAGLRCPMNDVFSLVFLEPYSYTPLPEPPQTPSTSDP